MSKLTSQEIRERFLNFFEKRGHAIIPSASLVPENDPSVLFNTAGMQPLVPYLLGEEHPKGKRLADIQKCVRTNDIEEVGDNTHLTFFEMMGNWSLGDYWKKESINWSYELLTNSPDLPIGDAGFGLDPQRLYITCFEGDENAPKDEESAEIWKEIFERNGITGERIYFRPKEKNWWSAGPNGPCGPDTEMFYDLTGELNSGMTLDEYLKADDEQKVVEIWNNVFMQYLSRDGKVVSELPNKNVDTGAGFERMVAVVQGKKSVFETDVFNSIIELIESDTPKLIGDSDKILKSKRIVADHFRTAIFLASDGVTPSNKEAGYILRKLIRRALVHLRKISFVYYKDILNLIVDSYSISYPNLNKLKESDFKIITDEVDKFSKTIEEGMKEFNKIHRGPADIDKIDNLPMMLPGKMIFNLVTTFGFPLELIEEEANERGLKLEIENFNEEMAKHQELSRAGSEQKFKGGLSGTGEMETKYHTATHLLHQALRDILGDSVSQKGSNITSERLRFDFAFGRKLTDDEKQRVEDTVNEKIKMKLPVGKVLMKKDEAEKTGAHHFFGEKYPDEVNVYYIGDSLDSAYSKEFCGGPHVENIEVLGEFKIVKEEAVSAGVRRIKAVLN